MLLSLPEQLIHVVLVVLLDDIQILFLLYQVLLELLVFLSELVSLD